MTLVKYRFQIINAVAFASAAMFLVPLFAGAQATSDLSYFTTLFTQIRALIENFMIPIMFGIALLLFFWGIITYFILGADDEGKRETGRAYMLYSIIGLVGIVAVWGLVNLVIQILGIGGGVVPPQPPIPA